VVNIPIPFPYKYKKLQELSVKGTLLFYDNTSYFCIHCKLADFLYFIGKCVSRGIVWLQGEVNIYERIKIPLVQCKNCNGIFRVLPFGILPRKTFSYPSIENACRGYFTDTASIIKTVSLLLGVKPHYTTLYHWLGSIGAMHLDTQVSPVVREKAITSASLISETKKELCIQLHSLFSEVSIPPLHYKSEKRREELVGAKRLLLVSQEIFATHRYSLSHWYWWLSIRFRNVATWLFPSRMYGTRIQI